MNGTHVRFGVGIEHLARKFFTMDLLMIQKIRKTWSEPNTFRKVILLINELKIFIRLHLTGNILPEPKRASGSGQIHPLPVLLPVCAATWR